MTSGHSLDDRRSDPRLDGSRIFVTLRPRGRLAAIGGQAADFNRHGIAVYTHVPLEKDRVVYLYLRCDDLTLNNLVGVVHNCVRQDDVYRCGIRFRLASNLQLDKQEMEVLLTRLEAKLLEHSRENA